MGDWRVPPPRERGRNAGKKSLRLQKGPVARGDRHKIPRKTSWGRRGGGGGSHGKKRRGRKENPFPQKGKLPCKGKRYAAPEVREKKKRNVSAKKKKGGGNRIRVSNRRESFVRKPSNPAGKKKKKKDGIDLEET